MRFIALKSGYFANRWNGRRLPTFALGKSDWLFLGGQTNRHPLVEFPERGERRGKLRKIRYNF